jgi:hypothetical protein
MPDLKITFLTVNDDPYMVADVIRAGARGYLLKSSATTELMQAIRLVASNSTYITPLTTGNMLSSLLKSGKRDLFEKPTVRQREILQLRHKGLCESQSIGQGCRGARMHINGRAGMLRTTFLASASEVFGIAVRNGGGKDVAPSAVMVGQTHTGAAVSHGVHQKTLGHSAGRGQSR